METNPTFPATSLGMLPAPGKNKGAVVTSAGINLALLLFLFWIATAARPVVHPHGPSVTLYVPESAIIQRLPLPRIPTQVSASPLRPEVPLAPPRLARSVSQPDPLPISMALVPAPLPLLPTNSPSVFLVPQPRRALEDRNEITAALLGPAVKGGIIGSDQGRINSRGNGSVSSAGIDGGYRSNPFRGSGPVAPAVALVPASAPPAHPMVAAGPGATGLVVLSKPPALYTAEARQLKVEGAVVLRITFTASGQVVVEGVEHGLGHGLDEEALRVARLIRFRPATRDGHPVDVTTSLTIKFQLA